MKAVFTAVLVFLLSCSAAAQAPHDVHIVYMGGDDCPPCVFWRLSELPRLKETDVWRSVTFSFVNKTVRSAVPAKSALPPQVQPFKDKLDAAGGRNIGSPQIAFIVDGEVYDYFFGGPTALEMETRMLAAIKGQDYGRRCTERGPKWVCQRVY